MIFGFTDDDVIAAIASPPGRGAIGIVRLSGKGAVDVLSKVFFRSSGVSLKAAQNQSGSSAFESRHMYFGFIKDNQDTIDEVMACVFKSPRSYTCEDMAEIYTHGGVLVTNRVLETLTNNGARLALPGEFTKRAFLNGRINLSQAEAVMDIIGAGSETARKAGLKQLGGGLSGRVTSVRDRILSWLAHIELSIDYPEHEEEAKNLSLIGKEGEEVLQDLKALLATASIGRLLREGIKTAIIGRPNVGKSTLLNAILSEDRAIVTEIPGTTRDVLVEQVQVGGLSLVLMDTAGLRETEDSIEQIGVKKSIEAAQEADLILYVVDLSDGFTAEDEANLENIPEGKRVLVVVNKIDLADGDELFARGDVYGDLGHIDAGCRGRHPLRSGLMGAGEIFFGDLPGVGEPFSISAKTGLGLEELLGRINDLFFSGEITATDDIITRERHKELIGRAVMFLEKAMADIREGATEDLVSIGLRGAYLSLGEVLGVETSDDIVDRIFEEFCVGK